MRTQDVHNGKLAAIIAYFSIIGTVIAIFINQDEKKSNFASFHIRQALGLFISFFLLGYFVGYADSWTATLAFYLCYMILWVYGFVGALQEQTKPIPMVGQFFQNIFKNL